jgi:plasmid stabilization system protein ParE
MKFTLVISEKAKKHSQEAYDYYETKQQMLGERFLQTIEHQYEKLKANPQHYSFLSGKKDLRFVSVPHFPFTIIFEIKKPMVLIIDVHNTHQHPDEILKENVK